MVCVDRVTLPEMDIAFIKRISLQIRNHETRMSGDAGMLRCVKIGK